MAYYIFLKSLRSLEEFTKNPHVKIPTKSPSTIFQSLGKFKNPIFNPEILFLHFRPPGPRGHPTFFLLAPAERRLSLLPRHRTMGAAPLLRPPHNPPPPLLNHARAVAIWNQSSAVSAPPPRRQPSSGEWSPGRAASCPSRLHPRGEPPWPGAAARPSSSEPLPSATGGVHGGPVDRPPRRWSTSHGPSQWHFLLENNSGIEYSSHFFI
jgi:hypothetical protein